MDDLFLVVLSISVLTSPFWIDWLLYHNRMSVPEGCSAAPDAIIIDVAVNPVGNSKTRRLKTIVFFSDGTQYITFKSRDKMGFISLRMTVDKEVLAEIFKDAVAAHDKLCSSTRSQSPNSSIPTTEPKVSTPSVESGQKFVDPKPEIVEPSPTTPKHRFCKLCGSPIDPATRKCTGCGKQYFRPPVLLKKHLAIVAGILACVAVVFLIFTLTAQRNAAETKVEELNAQIAELNTKLAEQKDISHKKAMTNSALRSAFDELQKRYDKLSEEHAMYRDSLRYCESYCGFIIPTGSSMYNGVKIYHRLDCPYAESTENLVMIEIGYLEEKGYKPCPHCYG